MTMLAHELDFVIGVDTHRDAHSFALLSARAGALLAEAELPASAGGYRRALALAQRRAPGRRAWAIEGTGSYGAGLARFLAARGERVLEVERPARSVSRGGKSDALDALRAARTLLAGSRAAQPRAGGEREALRVLLAAREGAVALRRSGLNELRALLVTAPSGLRERLAGLGRATLVRRCRELRAPSGADPQLQANQLALRLCARRVEAATREAAALEREIAVLVERLAPALIAQRGVGPISAATILVAWSHRGRLHSEAAFARLAGAAPIPASSGQVVRHRLDRGGDRRLNRALHTIALVRSRCDHETAAYIKRRRGEGKSAREALRCLKRYLARSLFRILEAMPNPA
jgi:transposase